MALTTLACAAPPPAVVREADASRGGMLGDDGPFGVVLHERTFRVRVDGAIDADVLVPFDDRGEPLARRPVVVFLHGGLVGRHHYRWLTTHLASRGVVVVAPAHPLDLPFFEQSNGLDVLDAVRAASEREGDPLEATVAEGPGMLVGHSLGGVVGASLWGSAPDSLSHLALLASYPASSDFSARGASGGRVLSIAGGSDARVSVTQAQEGARALATSGAEVQLAVVDGMTHMQLAGGAAPDEAPGIDDETARARTRVMIDALLEDLLTGASATLDDPSRWPDGVRAEWRP